ncbi:unnamed protein product, partial [Musa acuminata var. zebrina]
RRSRSPFSSSFSFLSSSSLPAATAAVAAAATAATSPSSPAHLPLLLLFQLQLPSPQLQPLLPRRHTHPLLCFLCITPLSLPLLLLLLFPSSLFLPKATHLLAAALPQLS